MWFVRFFIVLMGAGLIYMVVTQETIPISATGGTSFTYSLWAEPVRFMVYLAAFAFFEWFLIGVHAAGMQEKRRGQKTHETTKRDF